MKLDCSMISPKRAAELLKQFAQFFRSYSMVGDSANGEIGPLLALVLAEPARQANRVLQAVALDERIDDGEILGVPSRETGTPEADHNLYRAFIRVHDSPLYACNCTKFEPASGMMPTGVSTIPLPPGPCPAKRPRE